MLSLSAFIVSVIVCSPNHALARTAIVGEALKAKRPDRKQLDDTLTMLADADIGVLTQTSDGAYCLTDSVIREVWQTSERPTVSVANTATLSESAKRTLAAIESAKRTAFCAEYDISPDDIDSDSDIATLFQEWSALHPVSAHEFDSYCEDHAIETSEYDPNDSEQAIDLLAWVNGEDMSVGPPSDDPIDNGADDPEDDDSAE